MTKFLDSWAGKALTLWVLALGGFAFIWFLVHGQIDAGIFQSLFSIVLGGVGVHVIRGNGGASTSP